jgi:alpha-ketoglutarate-dependent taurine dioxygenase
MEFYQELNYSGQQSTSSAVVRGMQQHKVLCLRGLPHSLNFDQFYQNLARTLGHFHYKDENPDTGALNKEGWLDMRYRSDLANSHPYRYGNGRMGLHIDGAYTDVDFDVIFFYCESQADFGGATTVIDSSQVIDYLQQFEPELLEQITTTPILFAKGIKSRLSLIMDTSPPVPVFNWNYTRVSPANSPYVIEMAQRFHEFCEKKLIEGGLALSILLRPGESLFIHNRLVLHGRNSFSGKRCLMKGAISLPDAKMHPYHHLGAGLNEKTSPEAI